MASVASGAASAAAAQARIDLIDGRKVESVTIRHPDSHNVVVFENGLRGTLDQWGKVLDGVSAEASVFAYNRPGYANSEASETTRDGQTIAKELRQVLRHKGLAPPYVLVGHSLGALYVQQFARMYPQEVAGIVLVDGLLPRMVKKPEEFPFTTRLAKRVLLSNTVSREVDNIHATGEQVLALPGIDSKPMIRLINVPTASTAIPVDFGAFNRDASNLAFIRALYPNARKVMVDSDHQMQSANPEAVVKAIRELLERQPAAHPH
nr:alpha/beta fold hydrolase [Massilia soli]